MNKVRARGESIRQFIFEQIGDHHHDIAAVTAEHFGISRQAVNKHLQRLVEEKALVAHGETKARRYALRPLDIWHKTYPIESKLTEDGVWRSDIGPAFEHLPENIRDIWHYGFTEMFNNVIDHAQASSVTVYFKRTAMATELMIIDDGMGIFRKIQDALGLLDERHAVLELAKGKFTTDPFNHSGEGIFFTSRMFDRFDIISGDVYFTHHFEADEDWILEAGNVSGTQVWMKINNHTARNVKKVFDQYTAGDDFGFDKTVVPVRLAQYGDDKLVSRSQAKRLLARVDRFKVVILDFEGVETIGQAFADEVFRVFTHKHPQIDLVHIHTTDAVMRMIKRATAGGYPPEN